MSTVSDSFLASVNGNNSAAAKGSNGLTSNNAADTQNQFLKLLTTQLQNQDPTAPMDNAQLTSQIAQLSTVSGIEQLNASVGALMASLQTSQTMQAASMIGHSVLAPGNSLVLTSDTTKADDGTETTSSKAIFGVHLNGDADSVKINVKDSTGKVVYTVDLGNQSAGTVPVIWDGTENDGTHAPDGQYTFDVVATSKGQPVASTALAFGNVVSVTNGTGGAKLNVSNIGTIGMDDVVQIL